MELNRIPQPNFSLHPAYGVLFKNPRTIDRLRALRRFTPKFVEKLKEAVINSRSFPDKIFLSDDQKTSFPFLEDFIRNGAVPFKLAPEEKSALIQNSAKHIKELRDKKYAIKPEKRQFKHKVASIPADIGRPLYAAVQKILDRRKIIEAGGIYRGRKLKIKNMFMQLGDPDDHDWRNHFTDIGLKDPKTTYMHVDSKVQVIKCLMYISEVRKENGPTCYVLGSNRFRSGLFEYVTRKANDDSRLDLCDAENRRLFNALPKFLQKKAEFGNDLVDSDPYARELLRREKCFTSEDGDIFLIDTDGVHRGGMVQAGERIMLQVIFGYA